MSYELAMFPLGLVVVPGQVVPLHVFEPRYRALMQHCIDQADTENGPTFGIVLIRQGFEVGGGESRHDVGTSTRIVKLGRFPDGRFALETVGTHRVSILEWLEDDPYPRAIVTDLADTSGDGVELLMTRVISQLRRVLGRAAEAGHEVAPATFMLPDDPLAASYAAVAHAPLATPDKQRLLEAPGPLERFGELAVMLDGWESMLSLSGGGGC